jgi:hypothetical protein
VGTTSTVVQTNNNLVEPPPEWRRPYWSNLLNWSEPQNGNTGSTGRFQVAFVTTAADV